MPKREREGGKRLPFGCSILLFCLAMAGLVVAASVWNIVMRLVVEFWQVLF